jgi:FMN-dependent NADH-azoreductase
MNILHLTCSPRGADSESSRLSQAIVDRLQGRHGDARVQLRDLAAAGLPHIDADYSHALGSMQAPSEEALTKGSLARSEALIAELDAADYVVIGTPMHNFTVPSVLKAWIDHVVRVNRTFDITREGKVGRLADRPVLIAVASGGLYSGETARQPDFLTLYLKAILAIIGLRDLRFYSVEGMAFGAEAAALARQRTLTRLDGDFSLAA